MPHCGHSKCYKSESTLYSYVAVAACNCFHSLLCQRRQGNLTSSWPLPPSDLLSRRSCILGICFFIVKRLWSADLADVWVAVIQEVLEMSVVINQSVLSKARFLQNRKHSLYRSGQVYVMLKVYHDNNDVLSPLENAYPIFNDHSESLNLVQVKESPQQQS